jgi:hypothetical protein
MLEIVELIVVGTVALLAFGIFYLLVLWPTALILRRLGHSWLWTLVWFVPVANIVGFWMIAFRRWPGEGSPPPPKA